MKKAVEVYRGTLWEGKVEKKEREDMLRSQIDSKSMTLKFMLWLAGV